LPVGWFRRGRKGASDEPLGKNDFLVYVRRYANEAASLEQFAEFKTWLVEYARIDDWVFCGVALAEDENGIFWYIAVVDATPDARTFNEFMWTGEPQEIDEDWVMDIISRTEGSSFLPRMRDPVPIAAVQRAHGTWVIPRPEG
jgi:hypothetical protein